MNREGSITINTLYNNLSDFSYMIICMCSNECLMHDGTVNAVKIASIEAYGIAKPLPLINYFLCPLEWRMVMSHYRKTNNNSAGSPLISSLEPRLSPT